MWNSESDGQIVKVGKGAQKQQKHYHYKGED